MGRPAPGLVLGGVLLGSGLGNTAALPSGALAGLGQAGAAAAFSTAWASPALGVWLQLAAVLGGGACVVLAAWPVPRLQTRPGLYLSDAFGDPLGDFFGRFGRAAVLILALICVYRLSDFVLNIMTPFYLDLGFTKTQVAEARKVFGVVMSLIGVFAGGYSVARLGLMRSIVIGAFALPITNTIFAWLATQGPDFRSLLVAIGVDNVVSGFAGTCLIAYMSSLTSAGFTATQYALFSSLYSLPGKLIASQSGRIVESSAGRPVRRPQRPLARPFRPHAFERLRRRHGQVPRGPGRSRRGLCRLLPLFGADGLGAMALAVAVAVRTAKGFRPPAPARTTGRDRARGADQRQTRGDRLQLGPALDLAWAKALWRTAAAPPARMKSRRSGTPGRCHRPRPARARASSTAPVRWRPARARSRLRTRPAPTGFSMATEPAWNRNCASSLAESASFRRETDW